MIKLTLYMHFSNINWLFGPFYYLKTPKNSFYSKIKNTGYWVLLILEFTEESKYWTQKNINWLLGAFLLPGNCFLEMKKNSKYTTFLYRLCDKSFDMLEITLNNVKMECICVFLGLLIIKKPLKCINIRYFVLWYSSSGTPLGFNNRRV